MAYNPRNLSVLAYANGFTLWHYASPDAVTSVGGAGYFNAAADMLRAGDMILANAADFGAVFMVNANEAGSIITSNLTGR